ncbi:MAG: hypothetical protein EA380_05020 [Phycisphaeraceae bacterium]|nr:MAG: hypothetical protein EA380_05020 [Phycisphaeraceae bacterium]
MPSACPGQTMHTVAALENAAQRQTNWAEHRVWVSGEHGGVQRYASGVLLDPWNVLVSGHQVFSSGSFTTAIRIGRGSNHITDPGDIFAAADYVIHPAWGGVTFPLPFFDTVDLAILHMASPIPGVTPLNISAAELGQTLVGVGYGRPATPNGYLEPDGQARAFNLYYDRAGSISISSDYMLSNFYPPGWSRNDPLEGGATPGNSGGGVFNAEGDLVGLTVGAAGSPPGYGYATITLRLDLYQSWIIDNIIVPAPGTASAFAIVGVACLRRRRRAVVSAMS